MLQRSEGQGSWLNSALISLAPQRVKTGHRAPRVTLTRQRLRHQLFFGCILLAIIVERCCPILPTNPILSLNYSERCAKLRPSTGGVWAPLEVFEFHNE